MDFAPMTDPDYSTWLTKAQAAEALKVSTKTIEQWAKEQKLGQAFWRRDGRGNELAVYDPDDVARIALERRRAAVPVILPADPTTNGNGHGSLAAVSPFSNFEEARRAYVLEFFSEFAGALRAVSAEHPPTSESSQNSEKLFLTISEASAVSGLSVAYLKRRITDKSLPAERDRGWKIRRKDLEAL